MGSRKEKKISKKRAAPETKVGNEVALDHEDPMDKTQIDFDPDELTMGEKLAKLDLVVNNKANPDNATSPPGTRPPSADSIHVLLKQALQADDRTLLVDCLNRQDEKVITNSVAQLNPSDVNKLLESLMPIVETRGAALDYSIPWLRTLLLQHASRIMSQESSLLVLNTLYQLIESRVSTFGQALRLSSCLDLLYAGKVDDEEDENDKTIPAIYEDIDESEEDRDAMETESEEDDEPTSRNSDKME